MLLICHPCNYLVKYYPKRHRFSPGNWLRLAVRLDQQMPNRIINATLTSKFPGKRLTRGNSGVPEMEGETDWNEQCQKFPHILCWYREECQWVQSVNVDVVARQYVRVYERCPADFRLCFCFLWKYVPLKVIDVTEGGSDAEARVCGLIGVQRRPS